MLRDAAYHIHCFGINCFGNNVFVFGYILDHLVEGGALHLLPFQIRQGIRLEVEENAALPQLLYKKFLSLVDLLCF